MGEILFLAHRIPFPPNRGDKIRSHHILKALANLGPVHVGCLAENDEDRGEIEKLGPLAESHCVVERPGSLVAAGLRALVTGKTVSETSFHSRELQEWVTHTLNTRPISAIYVFSGQMGAYLPDDFNGRLVLDLVDVDSAKFDAYGAKGGLMAPIHRREGRLLRAMEAALAARAEHTLLVTDEEAELLRSRLPEGSQANVSTLRNGIDAQAFDPERTFEPVLEHSGAPRLIFTGQMDYPPNEVAARRLAYEILPNVRARHPRASAHIVGRAPTADVRALEGEGVRVWGGVPDMRDYLASADIAVIPLSIARGVQNKVLEAMAMGLPCVVSEGAATGIPARDGQDFIVAGSDEEFAGAIDRLASDPAFAASMGASARQWVLDHASWEAALEPLPALMGMSGA